MAASKTALANVALSKLGTVLINHIDQLNSKEAETARTHYDTVLAEVLKEHPWVFARSSAALSLASPAAADDITATIPGYDEAVFEYEAGDNAYYAGGETGGLTFVIDSVTTKTGTTASRWTLKNGATILYIAGAAADHPFSAMRWLSYDWAYAETDLGFHYPATEGFRHAYSLPSGCVVVRSLKDKSGNPVTAFRRAYAFGGQVILCDAHDAIATYTALVTDTTMFDPLFERAMTCLLASRMARRITGSDSMENSMLQAYDIALADARFRDAQTDSSNENRRTLDDMVGADFLVNRDEY